MCDAFRGHDQHELPLLQLWSRCSVQPIAASLLQTCLVLVQAAIAAVLSTIAGASGLVIASTFVVGATLCSLAAVLVALGGTLGAVLTFLAFFTVIGCMVTLAAAGSMAACAAFGEFP